MYARSIMWSRIVPMFGGVDDVNVEKQIGDRGYQHSLGSLSVRRSTGKVTLLHDHLGMKFGLHGGSCVLRHGERTPAPDPSLTSNEENAAGCTTPLVWPADSEAHRSTNAMLQATGTSTLFDSRAYGKLGDAWGLRTSPIACKLHGAAFPKLDQQGWAEAASEFESWEVCHEEHIPDVQW